MNISKKVTLSSVSVDSNRLDIRLTIDEDEQYTPKKLVWVEYNLRSDMYEVYTNYSSKETENTELKQSFDMGFNMKGGYVNKDILQFITALVKEGYIFIGVR